MSGNKRKNSRLLPEKRQRTGRREQNVAKAAKVLYYQGVKIVVVTLGGNAVAGLCVKKKDGG